MQPTGSHMKAIQLEAVAMRKQKILHANLRSNRKVCVPLLIQITLDYTQGSIMLCVIMFIPSTKFLSQNKR